MIFRPLSAHTALEQHRKGAFYAQVKGSPLVRHGGGLSAGRGRSGAGMAVAQPAVRGLPGAGPGPDPAALCLGGATPPQRDTQRCQHPGRGQLPDDTVAGRVAAGQNDPRTGDRPAHCDRLRNALWRQNVLRRGACGGLFGHCNRRRHRESGQAGWPAAGRPGDPAGGGGNRNERCRPRSAGSGRRPAAGAGLCPGQRTAADCSHPCVG